MAGNDQARRTAAVLPGQAAAALVFGSSAAVLVLEILGMRLLAPYVGLTLETTTMCIGVVLGGIALGAAVGGQWADVADPRRLLAPLLGAGGLLALATVPMVRVMGSALEGSGSGGALLIALFALLPPAAALSAVTPVVAKLQLGDLRTSGSVVGRLSAWATGGGLAGTFATGFVLVPLLPVTTAVIALGATLVLAALVVSTALRALSPVIVLATVAGGLGLAAAGAAAGRGCTAETTYHCARVVEDPQRASGRLLVLDDLRHSYVDLRDPRHLEFPYARWIGDAVDAIPPAGGRLDAIFVGGGGFTLPRYLASTRPGSHSRVLEVDAPLVDLARAELGLRTGTDLAVRPGDARVTLREEPDASADIVVGDAFGGRSVPWHLATAEFAAEVRRVLRPGGIYLLNLIDWDELALLRAEAATLRGEFAHVALLAVGDAGRPAGGNLVLVASGRPLPPAVTRTGDGVRFFDAAQVARIVAGAEPLTDDDAPADQLLGDA